ncbi:MAG: vitamin-B12 independent methionine synthase, partial [Candidatus Tectomicrobia bacterium]|nr:vitamin-B12 independent methionine synthase [Candidatus Tectomicrobia bacterium]
INPEQIYLNPDCGFGTFADRPVGTFDVAFKKLRTLSRAAESLRGSR